MQTLATLIGMMLGAPILIGIIVAPVFAFSYGKDWRLRLLCLLLLPILISLVAVIYQESWGPWAYVYYIAVVYVALCIPFSIRWFLFVRKHLVPDEPEEPEVPIGELPTI